jgi:hypothetical protein
MNQFDFRESSPPAPHNNRMQRSGHDKVHGRGRSLTVHDLVLLARVLIDQRAVADAGRWATEASAP